VVTTRFQHLIWPQLRCLILGNCLIIGSFTLYDIYIHIYIYCIYVIGLTPGGSSTVHIYTQTTYRIENGINITITKLNCGVFEYLKYFIHVRKKAFSKQKCLVNSAVVSVLCLTFYDKVHLRHQDIFIVGSETLL
jgi:hypothetical protein